MTSATATAPTKESGSRVTESGGERLEIVFVGFEPGRAVAKNSGISVEYYILKPLGNRIKPKSDRTSYAQQEEQALKSNKTWYRPPPLQRRTQNPYQSQIRAVA